MNVPINPYVAGPPLREQRGFFGRQAALDWVIRELRHQETNALVLHGQRRVGKTSLLLQIEHTLPSHTYLPIYLDLQDRARQPVGQLLAYLASKAARRAKMEIIEPVDFDDQGAFFCNSFLPRLYHVLGADCRPVFLFDEFDVLDQQTEAALPDTAAAKVLFPVLRNVMHEDSRPAFIFVIGRSAEDLPSDFAATFKIARTREIWVLDSESAEALVRQAQSNGTLRFSDQAVKRILSLTSNHPYLTQLLCQRIWELAYKNASSEPPLIDMPDVDVAVPDALKVGEHALLWLWDGLSPSEKIYAAALAAAANDEEDTISEDQVIQVIDDHASRLSARDVRLAPRHLVQRRVLERAGEHEYRLSIEIFRRWLRASKPLREVENELDRVEPWAERLFSIGRDALYRGQWQEAVDFFHLALDKNPRHFRARFHLGEVLLKLDRVNEAVTELEQAYEMDRERTRYLLVHALVILAKRLRDAGDGNSALTACERALELSPDERQAHQIIWLQRGDTEMERGALDAAMEAYRKAGVRGWEDAIVLIQHVLDKNPQLFRTRLHLGEVLIKLGRTAQAVIELEQAYKLNSDEACLLLVNALVTQAQAQQQAGDEDGALTTCERVLEVSPGHPEAERIQTSIWFRRRDVALERNELNAALDAHLQAKIRQKEQDYLFFQRILLKNPQHFRARRNLGEVLLALGRIDEAVAELERAHKLNPNEGQLPLVSALVTWAQIQESAGEEEGALSACRRALDISPNEQQAHELWTRIWIRRGDTALDRRDLDVALMAYQHAQAKLKIKEVQRRKRLLEYDSWEREARAYEETRQWDRALELYQRLLDETEDKELRGRWEEALERVKINLSRAESGGWTLGYNLDERYEIVKQLASTARSEIYRARELQPPHQTLVVKRLKPDQIENDDARGRFEREIVVLRQIRHQSVLPLYDSKTVGHNRYFVTEYADKGSLKEYLATRREDKLRPIEALEIAMSTCQGLEAAHREGIVHRDVKPGNIFLFSHRDENIIAKLGDFSIARIPKELRDETLTQIDSFIGTHAYASPEQQNTGAVDPRSDLYSWAMVFFEMLTGESPTPSLKKPLTFEPTSDQFPTSFFDTKGVPQKLIDVLQRNLQKDPTLRNQSAAEVRVILESVKSQLVSDIERHLAMGESHIQSLEWQPAKAQFDQGLALCEWYGEPTRLHGPVGDLANGLRMGILCAQGMIYLVEGRWQMAIDSFEPLRTLNPNYLGLDIAAQLRRAQSERKIELKHQLISQHRMNRNWIEIAQLAMDLIAVYHDRADSEAAWDMQKLFLYAQSKMNIEKGGVEEAYHQLHSLYERDPGYEDVAELCAGVAYGNAIRTDIPTSREHQIEWLEKTIEVNPNHREGHTRRELDEARHKWVEELLGEG